MPKLSRDAAAVLLLIGIVSLFFLREIATDETLVTFRLSHVYPWLSEASEEEVQKPSITSDCTFSYYPRRVFATRLIRQGQVPFWNPHQFCGTPFFANFQSAVFYPINLLLYGFDPPTQMDLFIYIHFLIAAIFTFLLARKLGISTGGSLIASLAFTFCTFMTTRYGQPTFISTASWLPALILLGEHLREQPNWRRAGLLVVGLVFCILSGFPQLVIFNTYALITYMIVRGLVERDRTEHRWYIPLGYLLVAIGIAGLICSYQLLPTYELSKFSFRKTLPYRMIASSAHSGFAVLKYLIPDILGNPVDLGPISKMLHAARGGSVFAKNYVSTMGYVGILPLLLAVISLCKPSRKMLPFAVLAAISVLAVFGTGLLRILYHLPGFNFSRIDRLIVVYMFSFAILAGHGFDIVGSGKHRMVGIVTLCFAVVAGLLTYWLVQGGIDSIVSRASLGTSIDVYRNYALTRTTIFAIFSLVAVATVLLMWRGALSPRIFAIISICVVLVDLLPQGMKFKVTQPASQIVPHSTFVEDLRSDSEKWRFAKFGASILPANTATLVELDDIHGYDALNVNHFIDLLGAVDSTVTAVSNAALRRRIGPFAQRKALSSKILDLLNVRYILSVADVGGQLPQPIRWINKDCLPRAFLVPRARFFESYERMLDYMRTDEFDPAGEVLLRHGEDRSSLSPGDSLCGEAHLLKYEPNRVEVEVTCRSTCYLVLSDVWYPGWKVYVDGRERKLLRADYALRAVKIGTGKHVVTFVYFPSTFRIGLLVSIGGLALLAVMLSSRRRFWDSE